jgi:hypothetical protein
LILRMSIALSIFLAAAPLAASPADQSATQPKLSAAQIVDKNVEARGGLQAWRAVQTMSFSGTLGAGGNQRASLVNPTPGQGPNQQVGSQRPKEEVTLPFVMELKRPRKMRFELQFNGQTAIQVYDGVRGWKLRPFLNRREVEPYTPEEMKAASRQADIDGPLVDYVNKGTRVELVGMEQVEGRNTYKLNLIMKNGQSIHVWIDAETFLETKIEGQPRQLDGKEHPVEVYFRDYHPVGGLQIPFVLETKVLPLAKTSPGYRGVPVPPERIIIQKVEVNPKILDSHFSKPDVSSISNGKPSEGHKG